MSTHIEVGIRLVGGPPGVVQRLAQYVVEVEPGGFSQNDIAKKIYKMFVDDVGDRQLVKSIASDDKDCYDAAAGGVEGENIKFMESVKTSFNILFEFVFTIPDADAHFAELMKDTPKGNSCNVRGFPDCNLSFFVEFGSSF